MIPRPDASPRNGERRLCILVLDPDPRVGEALASALRWEAQVEWAAGGVAGLITFVERKPDLVIADALLPDVSSGDLLRLLRILRPLLPIAILGEPDLRMETRRAEASTRFPKPLDLLRCLAWIHECLDQRPTYRPGSTTPQPLTDVPQQHLEIVRWVIEFIERRFREETPLAIIARSVGVSRSHLCRIFRRVTGQSLKCCLTRRRLQAAKAMLRNSKVRVQQVATAVGYRDLSHFDRVFRRLEGQTPSSYRRRCVQETRLPISHQNASANSHRNAPSPA